MRHSVYCSCHRCNGVAEPQAVKARRRNYANGGPPQIKRSRTIRPALTQPVVSDADLKRLKEHFG